MATVFERLTADPVDNSFLDKAYAGEDLQGMKLVKRVGERTLHTNKLWSFFLAAVRVLLGVEKGGRCRRHGEFARRPASGERDGDGEAQGWCARSRGRGISRVGRGGLGRVRVEAEGGEVVTTCLAKIIVVNVVVGRGRLLVVSSRRLMPYTGYIAKKRSVSGIGKNHECF